MMKGQLAIAVVLYLYSLGSKTQLDSFFLHFSGFWGNFTAMASNPGKLKGNTHTHYEADSLDLLPGLL